MVARAKEIAGTVVGEPWPLALALLQRTVRSLLDRIEKDLKGKTQNERTIIVVLLIELVNLRKSKTWKIRNEHPEKLSQPTRME